MKSTHASHWMGAFEAFSKSYSLLRKHPKPLLIFSAIYAIAAGLSWLVNAPTADAGENGMFALEDFSMFLLTVPMALYALALVDGKSVDFGRLFNFRRIQIIYAFFATALTGIMIFFSLFTIVGVVWIVGWFMLVLMPLVDQNIGPIKALKESKRLAEQHKSKVWGLIGVLVLASFGIMLVAGILMALLASSLPLIPVILFAALTMAATCAFMTMQAFLYRWLQAQVAKEN